MRRKRFFFICPCLRSGVDFIDAVDIFSHPLLEAIDDRHGYGEERWIAIGWIRMIVGVVVYTEGQGDVIRIISARKATKAEVRRYEQKFRN